MQILLKDTNSSKIKHLVSVDQIDISTEPGNLYIGFSWKNERVILCASEEVAKTAEDLIKVCSAPIIDCTKGWFAMDYEVLCNRATTIFNTVPFVFAPCNTSISNFHYIVNCLLNHRIDELKKMPITTVQAVMNDFEECLQIYNEHKGKNKC